MSYYKHNEDDIKRADAWLSSSEIEPIMPKICRNPQPVVKDVEITWSIATRGGLR